jgi:16S rRNA (uracil1498-N3)-methyltransferase
MTLMRYFFIEQSTFGEPQLLITGSDARHIRTVLRLKPGDKIGLFDGQGFEYQARIVAVSAGSVEVSVLQRYPATAESPVQIIVGQAFLKEKKMDRLVRQLTELGISKWIPFFAKRSVPRPSKQNLSARTKRWEKISKEALKQCKRGCVTAIGETATFEEVLNQSQACDIKIAFWENESEPVNTPLPGSERQIETIFVLLGPEGGFTAEEIKKARARGFVTAALGPRILRAETATVAACVLLQYLYGDMGKK